MKQKNKPIILAVLIIVIAFIWFPKDQKPSAASADEYDQHGDDSTVVPEQPGKRTDFKTWGRDPFTFSQEKKKSSDGNDLRLDAIMWKDQKPSAYIDDSIVGVGNKISDKTVKQIEKDRVILTDGINDYILELSK